MLRFYNCACTFDYCDSAERDTVEPIVGDPVVRAHHVVDQLARHLQRVHRLRDIYTGRDTVDRQIEFTNTVSPGRVAVQRALHLVHLAAARHLQKGQHHTCPNTQTQVSGSGVLGPFGTAGQRYVGVVEHFDMRFSHTD